MVINRGPLFDQIRKKILTQTGAQNSKDALDWFQNLLKSVKMRQFMDEIPPGMDASDFLSSMKPTYTFNVGSMYFFHYDPKFKKELPYYDSFPMVIPIEYYKDGMLGLNLHYIPPGYRATLLNALMEVATNKNFDDKTKLKISYGLIKSTKKYKWAKPCIKRYLANHVKSKFIPVPASQWAQAIFMPFAVWNKSSEVKVWSDSINKVG